MTEELRLLVEALIRAAEEAYLIEGTFDGEDVRTLVNLRDVAKSTKIKMIEEDA